MDYKRVSLETINSGAAIDLFEEEFSALLKNLSDVNTSPTKMRTITLKISVKPTENRGHAAVTIESSHSFAPIKPSSGMVAFSSNGQTVEAFAVDEPKQMELPGVIPFPERAAGAAGGST